MTRECIGFTFDQKDIVFSPDWLQPCKSCSSCAILISGLEPSSETTAPRYLKLVTVPSFCPFTLIPLWMPFALFVIKFVFLALISILYLVQVLLRLSTRTSKILLFLSQSIYVIGKPQIGNISAAYANLTIMFFQSIRNDLFEKFVEEGG